MTKKPDYSLVIAELVVAKARAEQEVRDVRRLLEAAEARMVSADRILSEYRRKALA